jgi:LysM repeat protein
MCSFCRDHMPWNRTVSTTADCRTLVMVSQERRDDKVNSGGFNGRCVGRDLSLIRRDAAIANRIARGDTMSRIAEDFGLTVSRISQINHANRDSIPDDEKRELLGAKLDYVLDEKLLKLMNAPRSLKIAANGKPVYQLDQRGQPDFTKPVFDDSAIIEAAKAITTVVDQIARLYGLHRKAPKQVDETMELVEWQNYVSDLVRRNKELTALVEAAQPDIVEADVVPEITG